MPELQEAVKPHPHFMLFATQNPPGIYAGRKTLSRCADHGRCAIGRTLHQAGLPWLLLLCYILLTMPLLARPARCPSCRAFRSRFLELHVEDIPDPELVTILEKRWVRQRDSQGAEWHALGKEAPSFSKLTRPLCLCRRRRRRPRCRCSIAPSYAAKLVAVMRELQRRRASSNVFAGRHGFITPRDLFRCAGSGPLGGRAPSPCSPGVACLPLDPSPSLTATRPWLMLGCSCLPVGRRWAGRGAVGYQQLAEDGFAVLGERLRSGEERRTVQEVLQKVLGVQVRMARGRAGWRDNDGVHHMDGEMQDGATSSEVVLLKAGTQVGAACPLPPAAGHGVGVPAGRGCAAAAAAGRAGHRRGRGSRAATSRGGGWCPCRGPGSRRWQRQQQRVRRGGPAGGVGGGGVDALHEPHVSPATGFLGLC